MTNKKKDVLYYEEIKDAYALIQVYADIISNNLEEFAETENKEKEEALLLAAQSLEKITKTLNSIQAKIALVEGDTISSDLKEEIKAEMREMPKKIVKMMEDDLKALITDKDEPKEYFEIANSKLYQKYRHAITTGDFNKKKGSKWPQADLSDKDLKATAYMMPDTKETIALDETEFAKLQEKMQERVKELQRQGDLAADVFDIITALWLNESRYHDQMVTVKVDNFLRIRGLKTKKGAGGRPSGYTEKQRAEIEKYINILDRTWIRVHKMEVYEKGKRKPLVDAAEGRAVLISSRFGQADIEGKIYPYEWRVRPGDMFSKYLFSPYGRQTALLSQKALQYDPYRQRWEKRLARYVAWQWRADSKKQQQRGIEGIKVKTILERIGIEVEARNPSRTKERFEQALDQLQDDGVIANWQYFSFNEHLIGKPGWVQEWLDWKVIIEAPEKLRGQYLKIKNEKKVNESGDDIHFSIAQKVKRVRTEHNLITTKAAEEIGISAGKLNQIERGGKITAKMEKKLKKWLADYEQKNE